MSGIECSESTLDVGGIPEATDDLYFFSTQMQSKHEETVQQQKLQLQRKGVISQIKSFESPLASGSVLAPDSSKRSSNSAHSKKVTRAKPARLSKAPKSMSAMVRDKFEKSKLLPYFSGDQTKIDEFLTKFSKLDDINKFQPKNYHLLYSKSEWNHILRCIKLRFPNLNYSSKKNLKLISRKIEKYHHIQENDHTVWSQACSPPDSKLDEEELKWLYDLSDEQMESNTSIVDQETSFEIRSQQPCSNIMVLSQTTNTGEVSTCVNSPEYEVVLDSEPEPELLSNLDETSLIPSHQEGSIFDPLISFQSFPFAEIKPLKRENKTRVEPIHEVISSLPIQAPSEHTARYEGSNAQSHPIEISSNSSKNNPTSELTTSKVYKEFFVSSPQLASNSIANKSDVDPENDKELIIDSISQSKELSQSLENTDHRESTCQSIKLPSKTQLSSSPFKISNEDSVENSPFLTPSKKSKVSLDKINNSARAIRQQYEILKEAGSPIKKGSPFMLPGRSFSTISNSSPIVSPLKQAKSPIKLIPNSSNLSDDDDVVILSGESVYSTAKSRLATQYATAEIMSSIPIRRATQENKRKLLNTSRYEIRSDIKIKEFYDESKKIKVRNLGSKVITIDLDNEIPDSEDEEVSIIEITREIDEDELVGNTSILQVPSSPHPNEDILTNILSPSSSPFITPATGMNGKKSNMVIESPRKQKIQKTTLKAHEDSWQLQELNKLSMKELKQRFTEWNLKPVRSRAKMIEVLLETSKLIIEYNDSTQPSQFDSKSLFSQSQPTELVTNSIHQRLNDLIRQDTYWYEKIISYEPIKVIELQNWIESIGYIIEIDILKRYCDDQGITTRQ